MTAENLLIPFEYRFILEENGPITYEAATQYSTPDLLADTAYNHCSEKLSDYFEWPKKRTMHIVTSKEMQIDQVIFIVN